MRTATKQPCQTLPSWLKDNLGAYSLAPLTGQDRAALSAAVQIVQLYQYTRSPAVAEAFGNVVRSMQESCWHLAYHSIAHVMDWHNRPELWLAAGLPQMRVTRCKCEP